MADTRNSSHLFSYHAPHGDQVARYAMIRTYAHDFAEIINDNTPPSAEQTLAIRKIQEVVMWANAAIALNEVKNETVDPPIDPKI